MRRESSTSVVPWIVIGAVFFSAIVMVWVAGWSVAFSLSRHALALGIQGSEASLEYSTLPRDVRTLFEDEYPDWVPTGADVLNGNPDVKANYVIRATPPGRDFTLGLPYTRHKSGVVTCEDYILSPNSVYHEHAESLLDYLEKHFAEKGHRLYEVSTTTDGNAFVIWVESRRIGPFTIETNRYDLLYREYDGYQWLLFKDPE